MRYITIFSSLLLVFGCLTFSSAVAGNPRIVQTDCDTVSTDPHLVQIEFALINEITLHICQIGLTPMGETPWLDPCAIDGCGVTSEWDCSLGPVDGQARWHIILPEEGETPGIPPGATSTGLTFTEGEGTCCYWANSSTCGIPEPFYTETVCFECDRAVQAQTLTWGTLKSFYR